MILLTAFFITTGMLVKERLDGLTHPAITPLSSIQQLPSRRVVGQFFFRGQAVINSDHTSEAPNDRLSALSFILKSDACHMPSSINIGVFVLGAVLLLLSLVAGKFKLFGVQVEGTAGKTGRVIAFVFGIVFIFAGLSRSMADHPQRPSPSDSISNLQAHTGPEGPEETDAEKVKRYMLGTWDFEVDDPSTKTVYEWEMEFFSDGRFSQNVSVNTFLQDASGGTWSVLNTSTDRFTLTLKRPGEDPKHVGIRVININTAEDLVKKVVLRRVSSPPS